MENSNASSYSTLRLAVVVPQLRVADVAFNRDRIREALISLEADSPDWIIFPRLCLTGASCGDLFRQRLLQTAALQALRELSLLTIDKPVKVLLGLPVRIEEDIFEGLAILGNGQIQTLMLAPVPENPTLSSADKAAMCDRQHHWGELPAPLIAPPFRFGEAEILLGQQQSASRGAKLLINLINLPALAPAVENPQTAYDPATRQGVTVICSAGASESTTDQVYSGKAEIWQDGLCLAAARELTFETQIIQAVCLPAGELSHKTNHHERKNNQPVRLPFLRSDEPENQYARLLEIQSTGLMRRLMHSLMKMRVKPYYIYQCYLITGSEHFRTPVARGVEIIRSLRGHTSGYAVPTYVIDAPGGGGKIPVAPDYVAGKDAAGNLSLTNYEGGRYRYPDYIA